MDAENNNPTRAETSMGISLAAFTKYLLSSFQQQQQNYKAHKSQFEDTEPG